MLDGDANGAGRWAQRRDQRPRRPHRDTVVQAQGLGAPVTVARKTDGQRVYLLVDKDPKPPRPPPPDAADAGPRRAPAHRPAQGGPREPVHVRRARCDAAPAEAALHARLRRQGVPAARRRPLLFEGMLGHEEAEAPRLAYDRPRRSCSATCASTTASPSTRRRRTTTSSSRTASRR